MPSKDRSAFTVICIAIVVSVIAFVSLAINGDPNQKPDQKPEDSEKEKPDPKYVVPPLIEEPVELEKDEAKEKYGKQFLDIGLGGWAISKPGERRVVFPGVIMCRRGPVEYFACTEGGKDYESVLKVYVDALKLYIATNLILRLKSGDIPKVLGKEDKAQGDRAIILMQWKDKGGKVVTYRAEDLIIDDSRKKTMPRIGWTYTGSYFQEICDPETGKPTGKKEFAAFEEKLLIATFKTPSAIFNNPLPEAAVGTVGNPDSFLANWCILPPSNTLVKVIIRAPTDKEKEEISKTEKSLVKK